ncbi:bifunctional glutamine-synthetase adenylyltransferase/deadenyltransferase [Glycocaulis alkaliphilus]|uniref:Bifunctional glutamine-synthetase adenylyltransferase/deadenyltransferase n=1 Tax=Glycocaulis alkaliphilus TaxID=1434191 RepID=A0A3T0EAS9_9PROT|nr:bifunctional [glutamine synthetase] adenylyltransferase/[glutamine synthetase]-adenylyl-L-tyrosine phosphorylase [Glycocaulis alkaliphilus]AZU04575.1 bifunctional glutamine-synthetase adenylyltransferase/deadenyltransferase [Glycocaulis alkaliphilus]
MTAPVSKRITKALPVRDADAALQRRANIPSAALSAWPPEFLDAVMSASPYLARLMERRADTLLALATDSPESVCEAVIASARPAGACDTEADLMRALREAKMDIHLATALADLSGAWPLEQTTATISAFADAALQGALGFAAREMGLAGDDGAVAGFAVLALGKLGTQSLNYSSDIDLVVVWEAERFLVPEGKEPQKLATRLTQRLVRLMSEMTPQGYVFRTDLRLRPDPSSTPLAVNGDMARHYFEAVGQNWERAAYAKARAVAGDIEAGNAFIADLEPFIWRRTLDFAAVEDIRALAKQIQAVGNRAELNVAGHDVKLGLGGIREVEFYAQVLQLVFGGRKPELRVAGTLSALKALREAELIEADTARVLADSYSFLRHVEHRIQMLDDEQTQTLPQKDADRARVAALAGYAGLEAFDARVADTLRAVHNAFTEQFEEGESLATHEGSLVLTGVEPTPDTLETLSRLGFSDPMRIWHQLSGWAAGRARAARTERARRLFSRLAPRLVEAIGATGDADAAFARFAAFFEGLPSGVQPLSLLTAHPALADELVAILGLAPSLAEEIGKRPALLDVMLEPAFAAPLSETGPASQEALTERLARGETFEDAMNTARRFVREERLRIGAQLLRGRAGASEAAQAYSLLARHSVTAMAQAAEREMERRHGAAPGRWHVLGMGKLGGGELSADSDLDLIVVYEPQAEQSDGAQPLEAPVWFTRFTQRLVSALSAPTEEGALYPVDLALRPSGSAGPVAVSLQRFETYYREEAWVWERMAMTRASLVVSSGDDRAVSTAISDTVNAHTLSEGEVCKAASDMRARLERDKPAGSSWDLKLRQGGLMDIEFVAQAGLVAGRLGCEPSTRKALERLAGEGWLEASDSHTLLEAHALYEAVTQLTRLAHGSGFDPQDASEPFARRLAQAAGCANLEALRARVEALATQTRAIFIKAVEKRASTRDG